MRAEDLANHVMFVPAWLRKQIIWILHKQSRSIAANNKSNGSENYLMILLARIDTRRQTLRCVLQFLQKILAANLNSISWASLDESWQLR